MTKPAAYMEMTVKAPGVTDELFDAIADALLDCEGVVDPDLEADFQHETLTFHLGFVGEIDPEEAVRRSIVIARTAIHTAGAGTAGWDSVELVNLSKSRGASIPA